MVLECYVLPRIFCLPYNIFCLYFPSKNFTFFQMFSLAFKYFCFPSYMFLFLQTFLLPFIYLCIHSTVFDFLQIILQIFNSFIYFCFPTNIFAFLQIFLFSFKYIYFHSNVFAFFINFSFPQSFKFPFQNKYQEGIE